MVTATPSISRRARSARTPTRAQEAETEYVDLVIRFIGALNLSRTPVFIGTMNPCFHAKLDGEVSYASSVKANTVTPVWDETWTVKMVPSTAVLSGMVRHTEIKAALDSDVGRFETSVDPGAKDVEIIGKHLGHKKGSFLLHIESCPSAVGSAPYSFDGPIRYSRHDSPSVGALTKLRDTRLYSTWKIYMKGIRRFFGDTVQGWNHEYKAAQAIFEGPTSIAVRSGIVAGHRMLYARTVLNRFGVIGSADDVFRLLHGGSRAGSVERIKPAVYTYVICREDETLRFSETGAAFFVDIVSKHALHSNCAESVVYSGEFHPRPAGGWDAFSDETEDGSVQWELVVDNNSGTYSPRADMLGRVAEVVEHNFPGMTVVALEHDNPELRRSREACRTYAWARRGEERVYPGAADTCTCGC